jgi:hypothetical protein
MERTTDCKGLAVCLYTRHSVVTTTYKTDFVTYRGLNRSGEKR